MNKKDISVNISFTVIANLLKLISTLILTIVVPKMMGVSQYGYWQLFLLYTTYMGYSYLGIADGMYLKDGGKDYSEIDYDNYANRIAVLCVFEILLALSISSAALLFFNDEIKIYLIIWAAIDMVIYIPRQTMKLVLQATNRIKEYAISISIFTISNTVLICGMLLANICDVRYIVIAHAFTELLSFLYTKNKCREIWRFRGIDVKKGFWGCVDDAKIGLNVLFAAAASTVSIGIIRNAIESQWGIDEFGAVSLALSISKLFLIFVNSVAVVLFPILRRVNAERRNSLYTQMRSVLIIPFWGIMVFYYPMKLIISLILPQYKGALNYVTYLIPMCLFECIMALLVNTYLKTIRKERTLLLVNVITVLFSLVATYISVYRMKTIIAALIAIVTVIMLRTVVGEAILSRYLKIRSGFSIGLDVCMSVAFVVIFSLLTGWKAVTVYAGAFVAYLVLNVNNVKALWAFIKGMILKNDKNK